MNSTNQSDLYAAAGELIVKIEVELKRIARWRDTPLNPEKFENMGAFGMNTMSPEEWIQFVLIPNVKSIIADRGEFPSGSNVGTYLLRNLDGEDEASGLIDLVIEFDELFVVN